MLPNPSCSRSEIPDAKDDVRIHGIDLRLCSGTRGTFPRIQPDLWDRSNSTRSISLTSATVAVAKNSTLSGPLLNATLVSLNGVEQDFDESTGSNISYFTSQAYGVYMTDDGESFNWQQIGYTSNTTDAFWAVSILSFSVLFPASRTGSWPDSANRLWLEPWRNWWEICLSPTVSHHVCCSFAPKLWLQLYNSDGNGFAYSYAFSDAKFYNWYRKQ